MELEGQAQRILTLHLLREQKSPAEVAQIVGRSLAWVYKLRKRVLVDGSVAEHSRRPHNSPTKMPERVREAIRHTRTTLEWESRQPGKLVYIGATAIRNRMESEGFTPVPSISTIERVLHEAGLTHPRHSETPCEPEYPHLRPDAPLQLVQVDICPHPFQGTSTIACFNAIDVVSHFATGQQSATKRAADAAEFLVHVWQTLGIPHYTQVDNEGCFSGGFTHAYVLGKVVRLALHVGTELIFSPFYHPQSNGHVERFHQDYNRNTWHKIHFRDLHHIQHYSHEFFTLYGQSGHIAQLHGLSPMQAHAQAPDRLLEPTFALPSKLPLTSGLVHFIRLVDAQQCIRILNVNWPVPHTQPNQAVWATLSISPTQALLRIYDAAPDVANRSLLDSHPFPLSEEVLPTSVPTQPATHESRAAFQTQPQPQPSTHRGRERTWRQRLARLLDRHPTTA